LSDTTRPAVPPASTRGWRWLLVASLALNLVFIGGLGALWLKGPPGPGRWGPSQTAFGLMRFSRELPPERRDAVRRHLKEARQDLKSLRAELRDARSKATAVLASPDYTAEAMQAALAAVAAADNRMRESGTAALMKSIGELTGEERQKLAAAWNRRLDRERGSKGKAEKDGPLEDEASDPPAPAPPQ
jgi:uncharacterized membrane protein